MKGLILWSEDAEPEIFFFLFQTVFFHSNSANMLMLLFSVLISTKHNIWWLFGDKQHMMTNEKSRNHNSGYNLSWVEHECLCKAVWHSIQ